MPISIYQDKLFVLHTDKMSYALSIDDNGTIHNTYWGKRVDRIEDFIESFQSRGNGHPINQIMEECSSFGGMRFKETSMKVTFSDGTRDFRYRVTGYQKEGQNHLILTLEDIHYPLRVRLHYRMYEQDNVLEKWREVENIGSDPITLERFYSAEYGLDGSGYRSVNYNGRWGREFVRFDESVDSGKKVYESLYGLSAHNASPLFILHRNADEDHGDVYYGVLKYSGNFKVVVEATPYNFLNILIGMSDTDFEWKLDAGEKFIAPAVFSGYSSHGFTEMSNTISRFARKHVMPKRLAEKPLPILYNSWYATLFDVRCKEQIALAERAAKLGVELFVIDDGWFEGRDDDTSGLGDWYVDKNKFPKGLKPLIDRVNELNMKFGIWIEPEMVNAKSKIYQSHPDWIYRYQTREVLMGRNQYMLDMTNPHVVQYLINVFDKLLTENKIDYVKWDMNRYASEMASFYQNKSEYKTMWFKNTQGIYSVIEALRSSHPNVEFEACASGGGRVDYGTMHYFDEYWPSDNTDPLDRLYIQESYSYLYPIKYMRAWLTDDFGMDHRRIPLQFAMYSAMCGTLGIGEDLNQLAEKEFYEIKGYIDQYKLIRDTVQFGLLYRLKSLRVDEIQAVQYVKDDKSVLFVFLDHERYGSSLQHVKLKGLKSDALYQYHIGEQEVIKSGAYLMNRGLDLHLKGDYDSLMLRFYQIEAGR